MILLGIDPGTASTGFAVIDYPDGGKAKLLECAVVSTKANGLMHLRLGKLYKELKQVCVQFKPDVMIVERIFFNTNAKTAMSVGQARGVILLVAADKKMEVVEYTALEAKMVLTGYGRSDKKQMQESVRKYMKHKEVIKPDDANDAVAMALCYIIKNANESVV